MSFIKLIGNNLFIMGFVFLSTSKPNYINIAKLIPIGTTNKHDLMLYFSKTSKKVIHVYFILITQSILQKYQIGFVNGGITLVALSNSFTHTLWLKKATNFSKRILKAQREKRNFPRCLCSAPNSLCVGYAYDTLTTILM
jgi:hypothetical protein